MSSFTDELVVTQMQDKKNWRLTRPFTYDIGELGGGDSIIVPEGFITDFGSVPQIFWSIVSPIGDATAAYVLHDWLYHTQERSRLVSDAILLEAMEVLGVKWIKRQLIYNAVRLFGWVAYNNHAKKLM